MSDLADADLILFAPGALPDRKTPGIDELDSKPHFNRRKSVLTISKQLSQNANVQGDFSSEIRIYHYHSLQSGMSTLVYELIGFSTENDRKHPRKYALGRATHRKSLQNTSAASTHPREGIRMCSGSLRVDSGRF